MPKTHARSPAKFRQVNYDPKVFAKIISNLHKSYPLELGGFLLSPPDTGGGGESFNVVGCSFGAVGTRDSWQIHPEDIQAALFKAGQCGLVVSGMFHSHPWRMAPYSMNIQSSSDAELQRYYRLPLSLIVGICPEYWITATWRMGYAAPYPELVGREHVYKWSKASRSKVLSKHYYAI